MSLMSLDCLYFQKCVYLVYLSIIISGESIQAYGAQLVTVAIAQFRSVTWHASEIFEEAFQFKSPVFFGFFGSQNFDLRALKQQMGLMVQVRSQCTESGANTRS